MDPVNALAILEGPSATDRYLTTAGRRIVLHRPTAVDPDRALCGWVPPTPVLVDEADSKVCARCTTRARSIHRRDVRGRILARVEVRPVTDQGYGLGPCWVWTGALFRGRPYTHFVGFSTQIVYRVAYEHFVGPIPDGLELDHLCDRSSCCNPWHLEAVTGAENRRRASMRQQFCKRGHVLDGDNVELRPGRGRRCISCISTYGERTVAR